jgi:NitT/TauT family transport system substrate-binding protein
MKRYSSFIIIIILYFVTISCNTREKPRSIVSSPSTIPVMKVTGTKKVTFLPYWVTTAQFAGYYVGKELGIYKKYGIDMDIIPYQPFYTSTDLIKQGKADFAVLWLVKALELKDQGTDIVDIAQFASRSSLMLLTKKSSGINTLQDMNGKKAGIWSGYEFQPKALFRKYNLDVKIIPIGNSINLFLMGGVDIINANWFDEYHSIINSGYDPEDLNTFFFADYGLNFPEDGIYCLSSKLKSDPGLCQDFVNATLESWNYTFTHPEEAIKIVIKYAMQQKAATNISHVTWMLDRYRDLYIPKGKQDINTDLSPDDYQKVAKILLDSKLISKIPKYSDFYKSYRTLISSPDAKE